MKDFSKKLLMVLLLIQIAVFSINAMIIFSMQQKPTGAALGEVKLNVVEVPVEVPSPPGPSPTYRCRENWICTEWEPAGCPSSGIQTRDCRDRNDCGTFRDKPDEMRACMPSEPFELVELPVVPGIIVVEVPIPPEKFFVNPMLLDLENQLNLPPEERVLKLRIMNVRYEKIETPLGIWLREKFQQSPLIMFMVIFLLFILPYLRTLFVSLSRRRSLQ